MIEYVEKNRNLSKYFIKFNEKVLKKNYRLLIFDCGDYLLEDLKNAINYKFTLEDFVYIIEILLEI